MSLDAAKIRAMLAARVQPLGVFFRVEDGGWNDARLCALVRDLVAFGAHVDIAAIPAAVTDECRNRMLDLLDRSNGLVSIHQHGLQHTNHERNGRKSEFGHARSYLRQLKDIEAGQKRLRCAFGEHVRPIFSPPWSSCNQVTVRALHTLGFRILSRNATASALALGDLQEVAVDIDWLKFGDEDPQGDRAMLAGLEQAIVGDGRVGFMLQPATLGRRERVAVVDFIATLRAVGGVKFQSIESVAGGATHPRPDRSS